MNEPDHERAATVPSFSPWTVLVAATKAVPATRYALAIAGTAVALAIAVQLVGGRDPAAIEATLIGVVGMLALMTIMVVFAAAARFAPAVLRAPATVLVWSMLLLVVGSSFLTASCLFLSLPKPFPRLVDELFRHRSETESPAADRAAPPPPPQPSVPASTPVAPGPDERARPSPPAAAAIATARSPAAEATNQADARPTTVTSAGSGVAKEKPAVKPTPRTTAPAAASAAAADLTPTRTPAEVPAGDVIEQHVKVGNVRGNRHTVGKIITRSSSGSVQQTVQTRDIDGDGHEIGVISNE